MTRWSANHRTRRSRSALAYGEHSTAAAATTSPGSYTTSGTLLRRWVKPARSRAVVDGRPIAYEVVGWALAKKIPRSRNGSWVATGLRLIGAVLPRVRGVANGGG